MYFNSVRSVFVIAGLCSTLTVCAKEADQVAVPKNLSKPVCFVENKGQVRDENGLVRSDIKFKLATPGMSLYLGNNNLIYQFRQNTLTDDKKPGLSYYEVGVTLEGANEHATVISSEELGYHENYYSETGVSGGFTAHAYTKVTYKEVYPNIDWVVYTNGNSVEYDFVVRPGGNAAEIKLRYSGAAELSLAKDGSITANSPMGTIHEKQPVAFAGSDKKSVDVHFKLDGDLLCFETGAYTGTLTIDPYLKWSTYFGGSSDDVVTGIASYGGTGLLYTAGYTSSTSGVASGVGLPFNTFGGVYDAFLAAYNATGVMSWASYFGGTADDRGTGIAVDATGNLYVSGYTSSTGIGTAGTYQPNYIAGNGIDAFLVKFSGLGVRQWSTYFGGTGDDYGYGVACDAGGNIYLAGQTNSTASIASAGSYQTALSGTMDGFFAKFTTTGALVFSSYFGGSGQDQIDAIHCDAASNLLMTGQTNSINAIASAGAYQTALSGTDDAFVASFSSTGTINWGTYFGGTGSEQGTGITCDGLNNVAITGNTTSGNGIATLNASQPTFGGVQDGFVATFTNLGAIKWGTYFGGPQADYATGISSDNLNNFGIVGYTLSTSGIASGNAPQMTIAGSFDGYVAKLDPLGRSYWSTYFGGAFNENANAITFDANNLLTFAGGTGSSAGLYSAGGMASSATVQQAAFGGGTWDGFVAQFTADTLVQIAQPFTDTLVCAGGTLSVAFTTNSTVTTTLSVQISDATGVFPALTTANIIGSASTNTLTGAINCTIPAGLSGTGFRIRIISSVPATISPDDYYNIHIVPSLPMPTLTAKSPICVGMNEVFSLTANYIMSAFSWTGPNGFVSIVNNPTIFGITMPDSGMYYVGITHNGCPTLNDSVLVTVNSAIPATPTATVGTPSCKNYPVTLYATPGAGTGPFTYSWSGPGGFTATGPVATVIDVLGSAAGTYTLIDSVGGCPSASATVTVTLTNDLVVSITNVLTPANDTMICRGDSLVFNANIVNGGPDPVYQWYSGTPDTPIIGAIWNTWSSNLIHDGEKIYCVLKSDAQCAYPLVATSNAITIHVADSTPSAYITVTPDSSVLPGANLTFNAYAIYPNTITVFQWYVDDTLVPGANSTFFNIMGITAPASVKLQVFTPSKCANPDTAFSNVIHIRFNTGVANIAGSFGSIEVYPNPASDNLIMSGNLTDYSGQTVQYEVSNSIGQVVRTGTVNVSGGALKERLDVSAMPEGVYFMKVSGGDQQKNLKFTIAH